MHGVIIAAALCFSVSLLIEIVQAWMPSRSSASLDLLLNTLGALIGAALCKSLYLRISGRMKENY
jgi:VanZ family protein